MANPMQQPKGTTAASNGNEMIINANASKKFKTSEHYGTISNTEEFRGSTTVCLVPIPQLPAELLAKVIEEIIRCDLSLRGLPAAYPLPEPERHSCKNLLAVSHAFRTTTVSLYWKLFPEVALKLQIYTYGPFLGFARADYLRHLMRAPEENSRFKRIPFAEFDPDDDLPVSSVTGWNWNMMYAAGIHGLVNKHFLKEKTPNYFKMVRDFKIKHVHMYLKGEASRAV